MKLKDLVKHRKLEKALSEIGIVEPSSDVEKLTPRQAYLAGQMSMLLRIKESL